LNIALGTVQFGLPYGISNTEGQTTEENAKKILDYAKESGINTIDTAISYGDSEQRLGNIKVGHWNIITKLPEAPENCQDISYWVDNHVKNSLERLKVDYLSVLMLHRPKQLLGFNGRMLWNALQKLKNRGLIKKIGFSIYETEELDQLWVDFQADVIQAPYNIFDQQLKTSGWLKKLYDNSIEVHVRSIFLQGLLLINKKNLPEKFSNWKILWEKWEKWLKEENLTPLEACFGFVNSEPLINYIVVGVDSPQQLEQIINTSIKVVAPPPFFSVTDKNLINPSNCKNL